MHTKELEKHPFAELYALYQFAKHRQEFHLRLSDNDKEMKGYLSNVVEHLERFMLEKFYRLFPHPVMMEEIELGEREWPPK